MRGVARMRRRPANGCVPVQFVIVDPARTGYAVSRRPPFGRRFGEGGSFMEMAIGGIVVVACYIAGAVLMTGRGAFMVATINRMDPDERNEAYDVPRACRATGVFALAAGSVVLGFVMLRYVALLAGTLMTAYTAFMFIAIIAGMAYCATYIEKHCKRPAGKGKKGKKQR